MMFQCCEVLLFMKQRGMVHSDIKPANILVKKLDLNSNEVEVAIGDFGLTLLCQCEVEQQAMLLQRY